MPPPADDVRASRALAHLDVDGSDERRFSVEVPRVDDVVFAGVEDELGQVHLAAVDGVQQGGSAGRQALAVIAMTYFRRAVRHDDERSLTVGFGRRAPMYVTPSGVNNLPHKRIRLRQRWRFYRWCTAAFYPRFHVRGVSKNQGVPPLPIPLLSFRFP